MVMNVTSIMTWNNDHLCDGLHDLVRNTLLEGVRNFLLENARKILMENVLK